MININKFKNMAIKVFDLQCNNKHVFEGWFNSHNDYEEQNSHRMIECPICSSSIITKRLSSPYINNKSNNTERTKSTESQKDIIELTQAQIIKNLRDIIKKAEDVGNDFAKEARLIQTGESEKRSIKGTISQDEMQKLEEDGIEIIPIPNFLKKDSLQ
ncbi:hypothetical protein CDSE_0399 [Candidatus Kinetoplastibacterium desouzaii TCC079E]|uniref:DUF1178 family protein n=1 Tax=Candidatus Kinetoplastidibacterium desouzai TCC079E TaxID=1208919 RepID=M1LTV5_9PROT|nr:DUF1178 family protein [Candidatus Kinetoplastibacterium desouzaii]AGF46724.1 hypothetical protein CDSE_0399 [Candidatus Kinetoplastibacterium desouzaii TCC079E]